MATRHGRAETLEVPLAALAKWRLAIVPMAENIESPNL